MGTKKGVLLCKALLQSVSCFKAELLLEVIRVTRRSSALKHDTGKGKKGTLLTGKKGICTARPHISRRHRRRRSHP